MFNIDIEYGYENPADSLLCLKYISFNNIFNVIDSNDSTYFRILYSYLDTQSNLMSTVVLHFNNKVDRESGSRKENYEITVGKKEVKINHLQVNGSNVFIRLKDEDVNHENDSIKVTVFNVTDADGNIVDKRKSIELYQYRELFVEEYNKPLQLKDSCYMEFKPLEKNCISTFSGKDKYWMNTPENIKITK